MVVTSRLSKLLSNTGSGSVMETAGRADDRAATPYAGAFFGNQA